MSKLKSTLGKKLNLIPQEWIPVKYKGRLYKIYEHECRQLQLLVKEGKLSPEDLVVYSTDGEEATLREDGRFYERVRQYDLNTNLAFKLM